jgi:DNA polymerase-3 subunit delta'
VTVIDRGDEASIKIKTLRERVLEVAGSRPFEARRRVFVIDGADDMTTEAQDALLKTLEEPPASSMLILVTAYPDVLLPTIQSRCRRLRFGPLSEDDVARVLEARCGVERKAARVLAAASGGSVSRALAEEAGEAGADRNAALGLLTAAAIGRSVPARLKAAAGLVDDDSDRRSRDAVGARLAMAASLLRDLVVLSAGGSAPLANADLGEELTRLAGTFDARRASAAFGAIDYAQSALDRNASAKIVADWVAVTI